jgi:ADP-dependent NAD(P)H-hydrate dehydratase / NAD(P)H-hydrate epimerase
MTVVLSRDQIRAYDRYAVERCGVPGLVLMENAGRGAAELIAGWLAPGPGRSPGCGCWTEPGRPAPAAPVLLVCGRGNNGGDGFVVGRQLRARGFEVSAVLVGAVEQVGGDARHNLDAYLGVGGALQLLGDGPDELSGLREAVARAGLVVDALFGTGLDRPIAGLAAEVIAIVNQAAALVVALDIPSGIDADTGRILGSAVRAAHTITFARHKVGMLCGPGADHAGRLHLVGLGLPDAAIVAAVGHVAQLVDRAAVGRALGRRAPSSHKYASGTVLVVAGRPGKVGAALLCARAALRAGAGLVTIGTWPAAADALDSQVEELMTARIDPARIEETLREALVKRDAVAIGPGLGLDEPARELCERVVLGFAGPAVVDADAITHFAGRAESLRSAAGPRVLTPHAGELGRLLAVTAAEIETDRLGTARRAAAATGHTVVLKGRNSIVAAPDGRAFVCTRGSAVLATGGSGDVLTGMIGALLCCAPSPPEAALGGVYLHGLAAELWSEQRRADRGLVASDLTALLPDAIAQVLGPS